MTIIQPLHTNWTARAVSDSLDRVPEHIRGRDIAAAVPGCIHTDLLAAGLIDDPYLDRNELSVQWIGHTDWRFTTSFDVSGELLNHDRVELVCQGLDTVASITLNGQPLGQTADMHLAYRFDARPLLRTGRNELTITFESALRYAERFKAQLGDWGLPDMFKLPFNFIRKMACNFGWDWGPTLVTAGIWQPIYLHAWNTAHITAVRPLVERADSARAAVNTLVDLDRASDGPLTLAATLAVPNGQTFTQTVTVDRSSREASLRLTVDEPLLWWPRGYGAQPLYALTIKLLDEAGALLDTWEGRIGLRTVSLNTGPDDIGSQFTIEVNGQPVFCKGADWIPDDCFPTRVDEARYRQRLQQAADVNMNMLRVWGGGIYEQETFYRICDEMGIMVWQDFLFACACYPEESPFAELVEAEARYQVARLCPHPSLVLWNGNNENIMGYFDWGWQYFVGDRPWGLGYYLNLLPRIVSELDPSRPYWPGSPYSGSMDIPPNADEHGNRHIWDVWHGGNYPLYRKFNPRFVSEFGFQAPPTYATLRHALPAEQLTPGSAGMAHHQKSPCGDEKNATFLAEFFDPPENFDDWLYVMQVNQARALTTGVEWFRSRQPVCMGTLYWQLNDCWPVTSWAAIDGYARPKPLWYATRQFYADHLLTFQPDDGELALFFHNDTGQAWKGTVTVSRLTFQGEVLAAEELAVQVPARTCQRVDRLKPGLATPTDPAAEFLVAQVGGLRATWFFDVDKNLDYPEPSFAAELVHDGETHRLTITAHGLLRDMAILVDRLDPEGAISDQLITLPPGETVTFTIRSRKPLNLGALTTPPVFQCVNRFGRSASV